MRAVFAVCGLWLLACDPSIQRDNPHDPAADDIAPLPGRLVLADGASWVNEATVSLRVEAAEAGLTLRLLDGIDIEPADAVWPSGAWPEQVTLAGADGLKLVTAVLVDRAGNASLPFSAVIELDRIPPRSGRVVVADGRQRVTDRTLAVSISDTDAELVRLWQGDPAEGCGPAACGSSDYVAVAPSSTLTLSAALGPKRVCWHFCDRAGNGTEVGSTDVRLAAFLDRPVPQLDTGSVMPRDYVAYSRENAAEPRYPLTVTGRGIAMDTALRVGNHVLPCETGGAGAACVADEDGGCADDDVCAETCARQCTVALPDEIVRVGGTYVVSLQTPAPVVGLGRSEVTEFLNVSAPVPGLDAVTPRSVEVHVDVDGQPVAESFVVVAEGAGWMNNVEFAVGDVRGRVLRFERLDERPDAVRAEIELSTRVLGIDQEQRVHFTVRNPPPGGGSISTAFGVNRLGPHPCPTYGPCVTTMRHTRPELADGRGRYVDILPSDPMEPELVVRGATAATVLDRSGRSLARVELPIHGGVVPLPLADVAAVRLEDERGLNRSLIVVPRAAEPTGAFADPEVLYQGPGVFEIAVGDLDEDAEVDIAVAGQGRSSVLYGAGAGRFDEPVDVPMGLNATNVHIADLDADGAADLLAGSQEQNEALAWRLGRGGRTFADARLSRHGASGRVEVLDVDRDGFTDLLAFSGGHWPLLHAGDGRGGLTVGEHCQGQMDERPGCYVTARAGGKDAFGDVDGDGWLDQLNGDKVRFGTADGFVHPTRIEDALPANRRRVADLDLDGAAEVIYAYVSARHVDVWSSLGDRRLGPKRRVPVPEPTFGQATAVGDADGDQLPDLLVATERAGTLHILPGDGVGGFGPPRRVVEGEREIRRAQVADVDADGVPDLLVQRQANDGGHLEVLRGRGRPIAGRPAVLPTFPLSGVVAVDFDGDGLVDLLGASERIVAGREVSSLQFFAGRPDGTFADAVEYETGQNGNPKLAVGDVGADGTPDAVLTSAYTSAVVLAVGPEPGDERLDVRVLPGVAINDTRGLALADVDGDGVTDLVACHEVGEQSRVSVWWGRRGELTFDGPTPAASGLSDGRRLAVGDVDGDGLADIVAADREDGLVLARGVGGRRFSVTTVPAVGLLHPAIADFDSNGLPDLAAVGAYDGADGVGGARIHRWLRQDDGLYAARPPVDIAHHDRGWFMWPGDMNGDGVVDLVVGGTDIVVLLGTGSGDVHPPARLPLRQPRYVFTVADLDENGVLDIVIPIDRDLKVWRRAPSRPVRQALRARPEAPLLVATDTRLVVHQAMQHVDDLGVRVRLEGDDVRGVELTLVSPRDERIVLTRDARAAEPGQAYGGWFDGAQLVEMHGWQPPGEWAVLATADADAPPVHLVDLQVRTTGRFVLPTPAE